MIKIYWCTAIIGLMLALMSCTKENVSAREQDETITIDFRQFPASTEVTLMGDNQQGNFVFRSDSLKLYIVSLPGGTYRMRWRLINLVSDNMYKAKWLNTNAGTSVEWESAMYDYGSREMHGTYTFTKERK